MNITRFIRVSENIFTQMKWTTYIYYFEIFVLDLIFPRYCVACNSALKIKERHLCQECYKDLPLTYFWKWRENPAEKRMWGRCYFNYIVSLFYYTRESRYTNLTHYIKYSMDIELGEYLGSILGKYLLENNLLREIDYIIPVPLHYFRLLSRGYNQAEVIARGIAQISHIKILKKILKRKWATSSQTKKGMDSKWENVKDAFRAVKSEILENKHILLVDDVYTSGATLEGCWVALKDIKGIKISVATLAYVTE